VLLAVPSRSSPARRDVTLVLAVPCSAQLSPTSPW